MAGNRHMTLRRGQIILVLFSVWLLAITLPGVHFAPGNWEAIKQGLAGKPPSLEILLGIILALAAIFLAGLVLLLLKGSRRRRKGDDSYEIYREPIPVPWSVYAIIVLLFAALAGLIWWVRQPSTVMEQQAATRPFTATPQENAKKAPPAAPPQGLPNQGLPESRTVEYILAIGFLAGLSWVAWRGLKGCPPKEGLEAADLGRIAARAAMDLEKGAELSDVVLRCYRDMCAILGRKVAMRREMTAREFAQRLQQAGVREVEVLRLTALFERVRYGRHVAVPDERAEAVALLQAIENQYGKVADEA
jgi:hypothetical protein